MIQRFKGSKVQRFNVAKVQCGKGSVVAVASPRTALSAALGHLGQQTRVFPKLFLIQFPEGTLGKRAIYLP
jgi:hypothetical protein